MGIKCDRVSNIYKIPHPLDSSKFLFFMADVPHLLKNLRAGLCKGNDIILPNDIVLKYQLPGNRVTVKHLQILSDFQKDKSFQLAPHLKPSDIDPAHFKKMDVGSALHVFCKVLIFVHSTSLKFGKQF